MRELGLAALQVLQDMLNKLRDEQNQSHIAGLDWIIIWLIVVCLVVALFQCASLLGFVSPAPGWHKL